MKKLAALSAVMLLPVFIFAAITATGIGATEDEAFNDAMLSLSKMVSISFTGIEYENTSIENNELTKSEYSTKNLASTNVEFLGVESTVEKGDSGYTVTLVIPDSASSLYSTKLSELEVDIAAVKKVVDSGNDEVKLKNLPSLYKLVTTYEAMRSILTRLDPSYVPKALPTGSSAGIKAQYSALYSAQSQKDSLTLQQYNYEVALGIITADSEKVYAEALKEIEDRQNEYAEMRKIMADSFEQKSAELELKISSMRDTLQTSAEEGSKDETTSISEAINSVEAYRSSFTDFRNEVDSKLASFQRSYKSERDSLVRRALTEAVTDSDWENGSLKTGSRTQLQNAVRKELKTIISGYQENAVALYGESFEILKLILQNADRTAKDISSKTITISSLKDPSLNIEVDVKSFANSRWSAKAVLDVFGYEIEVPFYINYATWTGTSASADTIDARISFNKVKSSWESLFADYANEAMEAELTVSIQADINTDMYIITVTSYRIINTTNGKAVASGKCNIEKTVILEDTGNSFDFTLKNDLLLTTAPEKNSGETDYARYYRILSGKETSSADSIVSPDYKGLNAKDDSTTELYRLNSFDLYLSRNRNSESGIYAYGRYDDILVTYDTSLMEYTGNTSSTLEKTKSTSRIGKLYYTFDDNEIFSLYDEAHTWKTFRFNHTDYLRFKLTENAEYGTSSFTVALMKNSEKVFEGVYRIKVLKPSLKIKQLGTAVYLDKKCCYSGNSQSELSFNISPSQTLIVKQEIYSNGLNNYGGKDIDGISVSYDDTRYTVSVSQNDTTLAESSSSRDGNVVTASYAITSSNTVTMEVKMKKNASSGKDSMKLFYTLDGSAASETMTINLEASATAWN